ncbi:Limbic system-associated membrane protein [Acipenser ruthenus]|uniref:Limbic system-associated membrane protein n=2 Tax=Acipenser ruthenus TaxID=7906 RepID=A0A662YTB4_ACIRT|nr:Limbic system-associated membrane protein [Acipenser ruthenus]
MESKNAEIPVGRSAALQCNAIAVPKPDFEWYRDDKRIFSAEGIKIQNYGTHSVLMVSNVTEEHYGNYTCVATNKLGINNANLFLYRPGTVKDNGSTCLTQSLWLLLASITCLLFKC